MSHLICRRYKLLGLVFLGMSIGWTGWLHMNILNGSHAVNYIPVYSNLFLSKCCTSSSLNNDSTTLHNWIVRLIGR